MALRSKTNASTTLTHRNLRVPIVNSFPDKEQAIFLTCRLRGITLSCIIPQQDAFACNAAGGSLTRGSASRRCPGRGLLHGLLGRVGGDHGTDAAQDALTAHMKIAPLADVKARFSAYVKQLETAPVVVTKNGRPVAVMVGISDEDGLERIMLAISPKLQALLDKAEQRIQGTGGLSHADVWAEIEAEAKG